MLGGGGEPCTLCSKRVYPAERINTVSGRVYHKTCFVCTKCTRKLTPSQCCEDGVTGRLYCEAHYRQLAKAAGLAGVASGGVDAAAGVLVAKRKKRQAADGEGDAEVGVGSLVWVELTTDAIRQVLAPEATGAADADADAEESTSAPPAPPRFVEPFVQAEVVSVLADAFVVRRRGGGEEVEVAAARAWPADEAAEEEGRTHADNLLLPQLNEPGLLHNVRSRFEAGAIYTHTGELELLALNPWALLPGLYGEASMRAVAATAATKDLAPHSYAVTPHPAPTLTLVLSVYPDFSPNSHADPGPDPNPDPRPLPDPGPKPDSHRPLTLQVAERIFRGLSAATPSVHSVVVSGESGSGKTETNKQLVAYLRSC